MRVLYRPLVLVGMALFILCSAFTANDWQHQHDEGVTFDIAIGRIETYEWEKRGQAVSSWPGKPELATDVYAALSGADAPSWGEVMDALHEPQRMPHPPLYYLLINSWARLTGTGTVMLRVPSMLFGLLTLLALWHLGGRLCGRGAGDAAVLMASVSPWLIQVTCFLRPYSMVLCLSLWATVALLRAHDDDVSPKTRLRLRAAFAVLSALGLYGVYHYVFVFAWHGLLMLWLAWRGPPEQRAGFVRAACATMAAGVLLYSPWLPSQFAHLHDLTQSTYFFTTDTPWMILLGPVSRWLGRFALAGEYSNYEYQFFRTAFAAMFLATYPFTILSFMRDRRRDLNLASLAFWTTIILLPALIFGSDIVRGTKTLFVTKYAFFLFPVFLMLSVRGVSAIPARAASATVFSCWMALLLSGVLSPLVWHDEIPHDYDVVTTAVAAHDRPGHLVVMSSFDRRYGLPLVLYMRDKDIDEVSIVRARAAQLEELIRTVGAGSRYRRITLLNLETTADLESIITDQGLHMWPASDLANAYVIALRSNFETKKRHVRGEKANLAGQGLDKRMLILEGIHHKTFHGPN